MAINDSQQRLMRTMLTGIPGLLALKNKQLAYEVANPAFCQFLGRAHEDILGKQDADLFPSDEAKLCQQAETTIFKTGLPRVQEQPLTGVAGKRWIDVTRAPVLDENGDPAGILIFARDITDFKQREEAFNAGLAKQKELEQRAMEAQAQLAQAAEREKQTAALHQELQKTQTLLVEHQRMNEQHQHELAAARQQVSQMQAALVKMQSQREDAAALAQRLMNTLQS